MKRAHSAIWHGREDILVVLPAVPPTAPPDVADAKAGLFVNAPSERLLECNRRFGHARVTQPAQPGRVWHAERHEAESGVDSRAGFVVEKKIARHTDTAGREQTRDLVQTKSTCYGWARGETT